MTDLNWVAVRTDTIDRFQGQTPRPEDEAPIIDVFEQHPALVLRAIDETAQALAASKITWAWSVLKARLERGTTALREATVDTGSERTRRIRKAKLFIENAGLHYDRQEHIEAELFGDDYARGPLTDYRDDPKLKAELIDHWRQQRPRGIQAEIDFEAWNAKCAADHQLVIETRRKPAAEPASIGADADIDF
jgi:hypothetical protein